MFTLTSTDFAPDSEIPRAHTCEGANVSPQLAWHGGPEGTRSYVLIVDDPDAPDPKAPKVVWVHWVLYNIPPFVQGLSAAASVELPSGTKEGLNDWKQAGWRGPCPPIGRHRYFFKLYALDAELADLGAPTKADVESAMAGHVLAHVEIVGTYQKCGTAG